MARLNDDTLDLDNEYYPYDEEDDAYDELEDDFDCHLDREGYCGKAGSEECEFECPFRNR